MGLGTIVSYELSQKFIQGTLSKKQAPCREYADQRVGRRTEAPAATERNILQHVQIYSDAGLLMVSDAFPQKKSQGTAE